MGTHPIFESDFDCLTGCLRMNSGEEKADFTLPGSPLDEYLRTLELGEDNLFDQINSDAYEATPDGDITSRVANISLKDCLKSRFSELLSSFRRFHSSQTNGHVDRIQKSSLEFMKDGLELTAGFFNDEHTEAIEYEILTLEKDLNSRKGLTGPERIDLSFSLPILLSHLIWIVNFGSESFWLYQILHFFIFITTAYFLLLHLRSEILLWNQKSSFSKTLAQLNEYSSTFKKSDGLISRSLRLVRDITVIANGHVTVNSRKSNKAHDGASKLKDAVLDFISSLIRVVGDKCEMRDDEDLMNKFELEILFYQQSRSTFLHNLLVNQTQHTILDFKNIMTTTKNSIHKLEAIIDVTRKATDFRNKSNESKKTNFEQITKQSLFRSLSLHGRQLAEYAFQAENATEEIQSDQIEMHVRSIIQNYQLLADYDKQKNSVSTQVQSKPQTVTVPSQTNPSLEAVSLELVREDIRDDEVLECVIDKKIDQTESAVLAEYDEVDQHTKQASSVVFTELKSILHKEVNPEKRQKRKEELFPEFWSKEPKRPEPNNDVIIPDASLFSLPQSEARSNSTLTESEDDATIQKPKVAHFEAGRDDIEGPLIYDDERDLKR